MTFKKRITIYIIIAVIVLTILNIYVYNERIRYEYWDIGDLIFFLGIINASIICILGWIFISIEGHYLEKDRDILTNYFIERYYMGKDKKIDITDNVDMANIMADMQNEIEDIRDLTTLLNVSLKNLVSYGGQPLGIADREGSLYPVGEGLNELVNTIITRLDKVSSNLSDVYKEYSDNTEYAKKHKEDKDNAKETKPQTK